MKISDFAAHSGLTPDTIRYYERIGLLLRTVRDSGGRRSYGMGDLAWASFLRKLQAMDMPMRDRLELGSNNGNVKAFSKLTRMKPEAGLAPK